MATDNPRVAAYPPKRIYERLVEFKNERGLKSDSAAIIAILENYFFSSTPTTPSDTPSTIKRLDDLEGKFVACASEVTFLRQAYQGLQSNLQELEVNAQADTDTKLKTKKQKKPEESPALPVSESPVDYNQPEWEQKASEDDKSKESYFLSESELPESDDESISNSPSELLKSNVSDEPISGSPSESLLDIQSNSTLSDSPLELVESDKITSESISSLSSESLEAKEVTIEGDSGSPPKQLSVSHDNHLKTTPDNSDSPSESLSSSQSIKEIQNFDAIPDSLSGAALARRLDVSPSTLRHKKTARNFGKWTLGHDPDGITWHYDGKKFIPQQQG